MPNFRGSELLILLLVVVLLFGAKRLPGAARSIGRSMRILKAETKDLVESEAVSDESPASITGHLDARAVPLAPQPEPPMQPPTQP